ncbi:MAG: hypothetical protein NTU53_25110 [Planctomycetota bacterium]|nr:hypothetical protein [Planctomycetota bacterium]
MYQPANPAQQRWAAGALYLASLNDGRLLISMTCCLTRSRCIAVPSSHTADNDFSGADLVLPSLDPVTVELIERL